VAEGIQVLVFVRLIVGDVYRETNQMKPVRVETTFSRTLHLSSLSRASATFDSQSPSVIPPNILSRGSEKAGDTYPIRSISTTAGFGKARLRCSSCCLSPSKRHGLSSHNMVTVQNAGEDRKFELTEILYVANGQFKIQTTTITATAAKELQPKILPGTNFRRQDGN
jgi:hypothetical protein